MREGVIAGAGKPRAFGEQAQAWCLLAALGASVLLYVAFALTPSHYGVGFKTLGIEAGPWLGTARPIRSDEWIVLTPLFQIAVRGGFSTIDLVSPYRESLKGFWALPILDWSLLFKPQLWAFWLLPPAFAYSFYFAILWAGFISGYAIFLRQLGASLWLAVFGSIALFFSHFVQAWWTSNAPTFAFAPWPAIVFLLPLRPIWKAPLLFLSSSIWIFGFVYPAFIISAAFAIAILLLAFRRDALTVGNLTAAAIALGCLALAFLGYFSDLIGIMRHTIYPGGRHAGGGGFNPARILAHLLPFFTTSQFSPLIAENECQVSVVSTFLPLTLLIFADHRSFGRYYSSSKLPVGIVTIGLAMMLGWMLLPVPPEVGLPLLWTQVKPTRMAWGFGLLLTLFLVVISAKIQFRISGQRFLAFSMCLAFGWLVSKIGFTELWSQVDLTAWEALRRSWFDWIAIVVFGIVIAGFLAGRRLKLLKRPAPALFAAAAASGAITFGSFNPVQPAQLIFNLPETPFIKQIREQARTNPNGWAIVPGMYGALLNGAGVPSINHTLTAPQLGFFRKIFPNVEAERFNSTFNRYAHIIPEAGVEPNSPYPDQAVVPIEPFLKAVKEPGS